MTTKLTNTRGAKGFSLLELLLVVAVGAVLILAGLGAYRLVSENNNANQAIRQLTTLKQQVQQTFQGQASYGTTATLLTTMDSLRAVPPDMAITGLATGSLRGSLGPVTVTVPSNVNTFQITYTQIPRSSCVKLAQLFTPETSSDLQTFTINTSVPANYTQTTLATSCTATNNTLVWTFQ